MTLSSITTIDELRTIMIFGVGSLFLYLVVPVALFANEVRLAQHSDDTSGTAAIFNSIVQAFFFIIAWTVFVSIIFFLVIKLGGSGVTNPAVGVDKYWKGDWINTTQTQNLIDNSFPSISSTEDGSKRTQAKFIVFIVTSAKALELLLLGVFLALALKLSMSLPLLKMRRADHYKMTSQIDVGTMMSIFMTGILGWVIFTAILSFESLMLTFLIEEGATVAGGSLINSSEQIDELSDLKKLLKMGMFQAQPTEEEYGTEPTTPYGHEVHLPSPIQIPARPLCMPETAQQMEVFLKTFMVTQHSVVL